MRVPVLVAPDTSTPFDLFPLIAFPTIWVPVAPVPLTTTPCNGKLGRPKPLAEMVFPPVGVPTTVFGAPLIHTPCNALLLMTLLVTTLPFALLPSEPMRVGKQSVFPQIVTPP